MMHGIHDQDPTLVDILEKTLPRLNGLNGMMALEVLKACGLEISLAMPSESAFYISRCNGMLKVFPAECKMLWGNINLELTPMEFRVANLLSRQFDTNWSYRALYDICRGPGFIAGGTQGFETNVRTTIKRIRAKFKAVDRNFNAIDNVQGFGYRWVNPTN